MAIGKLQTEGDLLRWLRSKLSAPGVLPALPRVRRGTVTVVTTGFNQANSAVIKHGFNAVPAIVCTPRLPAPGDWAVAQKFNVTATDFQINVFHRDAAINLTADTIVDWVAVA